MMDNNKEEHSSMQLSNQPPLSNLPNSDVFSLVQSSRADVQKNLRVSVNDHCNFRCFFCHNEGQWSPSSDYGSMTPSEIITIIKVALDYGVSSIKLTGGEPLLYRYNNHDIFSLVEEINKLRRDTNTFSLSLVTNGTHLTENAERLRAVGLDRITISLPTLQDSTLLECMRPKDGKCVGNIIEGVRAASKAGLTPLKVNTVLFHDETSGISNLAEIPKLIDVCRDLAVSQLRLFTLLWNPYCGSSSILKCQIFWDSPYMLPQYFRGLIENDFSGEMFLDRVRQFCHNWSSYLYPRSRLIAHCRNLDVCFDSMAPHRFRDGLSPCPTCPHPDLCQEGGYALRLTHDGFLSGCLLNPVVVNILRMVRANRPVKELKIAYKAALELMPHNV